MRQMDLFHTSGEDYLYEEITKIRSSMDRRSRAIFSLIAEIQDQIVGLKEKKEKISVDNSN